MNLETLSINFFSDLINENNFSYLILFGKRYLRLIHPVKESKRDKKQPIQQITNNHYHNCTKEIRTYSEF